MEDKGGGEGFGFVLSSFIGGSGGFSCHGVYRSIGVGGDVRWRRGDAPDESFKEFKIIESF